MSTVEERKALDRLSQSYRRAAAGPLAGRRRPPAEEGEAASPEPQERGQAGQGETTAPSR